MLSTKLLAVLVFIPTITFSLSFHVFIHYYTDPINFYDPWIQTGIVGMILSIMADVMFSYLVIMWKIRRHSALMRYRWGVGIYGPRRRMTMEEIQNAIILGDLGDRAEIAVENLENLLRPSSEQRVR
jgi:hypothetical protein